MSKVLTYRYPQSPQNVPNEITKPSAAFRREVFGVLGAILFFIASYIVLVIAGLAIAAGCVFAGYWIITTVFNLWFLLLGVGLAVMAVFIIIFLVKFIFEKSSVDRSGMKEVKRQEHPLLFEFIEKVAAETQTPLPRKVFLSTDVNAFVFYDSTFWSMFLPIRKNLNIGLGLVNCVSISEFKAILAHEFGHFSQRSMKLHSYVYHVNHIIHNMLFNNKDYGEALQGFGNLTGVFSFVAELTAGVVGVIQSVLESVYSIVTRRSMALSRQMEFHADAVAATVSGSAPLARALYRLDYAQACYNRVLQIYNGWISDNRKGMNVFAHHTIVMHDLATDLKLPMEHGLVQVGAADVHKNDRPRVTIKDQWASHPSTEDREKHLSGLGIVANEVNESAWMLFSDAENLQRISTEEIYSQVKFRETPELIDNNAFRSIINEQSRKFSLHPAFKGFFDNRDITQFDPEALSKTAPAVPVSLTEILTDEVLNLERDLLRLSEDLQLLRAIGLGSSRIKTFDFDGKRFTQRESTAIVRKLENEYVASEAKLAKADQDLFLLYFSHASYAGRAQHAIATCKEMFSKSSDLRDRVNRLAFILQQCSRLYSPSVDSGDVRQIVRNMQDYRMEVRRHLGAFLDDPEHQSNYTEENERLFKDLRADNREFISGNAIQQDLVQLFLRATHCYQKILVKYAFDLKKQFLEEVARTIGAESLVEV
jgi:Zn-dependent protease with chaperone function